MTAADRRKPAKSPAERKRDERRRKRAGQALFRLMLNREAVEEALMETGHLREWDTDDHRKLEEAISTAFIELFIRLVTRDKV